MATMPQQPAAMRPRREWLELLKVREVAASVAITTMWIAVAVVSVWAPSLETHSAGGDSSSIPTGIVVALFAFLGSWVVARYAFRRES